MDKIFNNNESFVISNINKNVFVLSEGEYNNIVNKNIKILDNNDKHKSKLFTLDSWNDYQYWIETDKKTIKKINDLIKDIERDPYKGIGKPEQLKDKKLYGYWSRRIDYQHRIIYTIDDDKIIFISLRDHY
jgi:toxin YoeB